MASQDKNQITLRIDNGNSNGGFPSVGTNNPHYYGAVIECKAQLISNGKSFNSYMIIPVRRERQYLALSGPTVLRYDSAGLNPKYFDAPYGLIDIDGKI